MKYLSLLCLSSVLLLAPACRWGGNRCCGPVVGCAPACVSPCVEPCMSPCVEEACPSTCVAPCAESCVEGYPAQCTTSCAAPCGEAYSSGTCLATNNNYGSEVQGNYANQGTSRQSYGQEEGFDDLGDDAAEFDEAPPTANSRQTNASRNGGRTAVDLDDDSK